MASDAENDDDNVVDDDADNADDDDAGAARLRRRHLRRWDLLNYLFNTFRSEHYLLFINYHHLKENVFLLPSSRNKIFNVLFLLKRHFKWSIVNVQSFTFIFSNYFSTQVINFALYLQSFELIDTTITLSYKLMN